jgi:hypothetical protein
LEQAFRELEATIEGGKEHKDSKHKEDLRKHVQNDSTENLIKPKTLVN